MSQACSNNLAADIILEMATQFLGDESSIHILWWVIVLKILEFFCYFFTFGFCLQNSAVDFSNRNILAGSGVLLSRLAGFVYHALWPSYYHFQGGNSKVYRFENPCFVLQIDVCCRAVLMIVVSTLDTW